MKSVWRTLLGVVVAGMLVAPSHAASQGSGDGYGTVHGTVSAATTGKALDDIRIYVWGYGQTTTVDVLSTGADGRYESVVPAGQYEVLFVDIHGSKGSEKWRREWYDNAVTRAERTHITVTDGSSQRIDAELEVAACGSARESFSKAQKRIPSALARVRTLERKVKRGGGNTEALRKQLTEARKELAQHEDEASGWDEQVNRACDEKIGRSAKTKPTGGAPRPGIYAAKVDPEEVPSSDPGYITFDFFETHDRVYLEESDGPAFGVTLHCDDGSTVTGGGFQWESARVQRRDGSWSVSTGFDVGGFWGQLSMRFTSAIKAKGFLEATLSGFGPTCTTGKVPITARW